MQAAASLKITKYTVEVDVRNVCGKEERVQVFLAEDFTRDGRAERLQDVFESRRFIPVKSPAGTEMISTSHVCWVRMPLIVALDELDFDAESNDEGVAQRVKVELEDGCVLDGVFRYAQPLGRRRLIDYLAELPRWVPLRTNEHLYLIERDRIMRVVPVEVS
jgi:hypothetical protein